MKHFDKQPSISASFTAIASRSLDDFKKTFKDCLCLDQYLGIIGQISSDADDFNQRLRFDERPAGLNCVILVLESPHIEEFPQNGEPRPANGKTGKRIRDWLKVVLSEKYFSYGLLLMNSIQYQCSLGLPTKCFRDDVFFDCWQLFGKESFAFRLQNTYRPGDIVLNCCTKGNTKKKELRKLVDLVIKEKVDAACILRRSHPVSWFSKNHRNTGWKP